ncbi:hypothetical protein FKW77_010436 [Venturia effusa]|uniref:Uncharacterized protein n=1 Tax=Venturia effusa TaxID=50376 RepID=A0A517L6F9_9PEZI|nr:hypothetical protein FKW77_010436 [Venturia effusa]
MNVYGCVKLDGYDNEGVENNADQACKDECKNFAKLGPGVLSFYSISMDNGKRKS